MSSGLRVHHLDCAHVTTMHLGGQPLTCHVLLMESPREQELVTLVARGHTDAQIAEQLYISLRTVRSHLDRIRYRRAVRCTRG